MTEKLTKSLLDGVGIMSGSMMAPVLKSQPGQAFLKMLPGQLPLAHSLGFFEPLCPLYLSVSLSIIYFLNIISLSHKRKIEPLVPYSLSNPFDFCQCIICVALVPRASTNACKQENKKKRPSSSLPIALSMKQLDIIMDMITTI